MKAKELPRAIQYQDLWIYQLGPQKVQTTNNQSINGNKTIINPNLKDVHNFSKIK